MAGTLPYVLSAGSTQLFGYLQTWSNVRVHQFDTSPLSEDLSRIDVTHATNPDRIRYRLADNYLNGGHNHYKRLLGALGVNEGAQKEALASGIGFTAWFWQERDQFAWYHDDRKRAEWIIDDLFQLHRCLEQAADRIKTWEKGRLRRVPPGTEEHFNWLRRLFTSRVGLAQEAVGIKWEGANETRATAMSLSIFFDEEKRKVFRVEGIRSSLAEFFRLRTPLPLARSA